MVVIVLGRWMDLAKEIIRQREIGETTARPAPMVRQETCTVAGNVIQLQRMRDTCQVAGHCLQLGPEQDCELYLVRLGWCRSRTTTRF